MKRKTLKKLVCLSGLLFMTFPAWSAVPSELLPNGGNWTQALTIAEDGNPVLEGNMILEKGGNGGGFGRQSQNQEQEQTQAHAQSQTQLQSQEQILSRT